MILSKKAWTLLSYTWGLPMSLVGLVAASFLKACGCDEEDNIYGKVIRVGHNWGGVNLGPVSIVCQEAGRYTLNHEFGHSVQNCYFGFLYPFIVAIPSALRYWDRRYKVEVEHVPAEVLPPYDSIWFEGNATSTGNKYYEAQSN